jgi:hypothetical protein
MVPVIHALPVRGEKRGFVVKNVEVEVLIFHAECFWAYYFVRFHPCE